MHGAAQNHLSDRLVAADPSERSRVMELARTFTSSASSAEDFFIGTGDSQDQILKRQQRNGCDIECNKSSQADGPAFTDTHPGHLTDLTYPDRTERSNDHQDEHCTRRNASKASGLDTEGGRGVLGWDHEG